VGEGTRLSDQDNNVIVSIPKFITDNSDALKAVWNNAIAHVTVVFDLDWYNEGEE
jgi:hypothetical protein